MVTIPSFSAREFKDYVSRMSDAWEYMNTLGSRQEGIAGVMRKRGYEGEAMRSTLERAGVVYLDGSLFSAGVMKAFGTDLGLTVQTKNGGDFFLLSDRYVLPIRDMAGNIVALVGWNNDSKKYLTTSSKYFSKNTMFYGLENIARRRAGEGIGAFIVEGIFDRLAVESAGGLAFATMGINTDIKKRVLYSLMGRVVGIPDTDSEGSEVVVNDEWRLPSGSSYFRWTGTIDLGFGKPVSIKDIDDFMKIMDPDDAGEMLRDVYDTVNQRVVRLRL